MPCLFLIRWVLGGDEINLEHPAGESGEWPGPRVEEDTGVWNTDCTVIVSRTALYEAYRKWSREQFGAGRGVMSAMAFNGFMAEQAGAMADLLSLSRWYEAAVSREAVLWLVGCF